MTPSEWEKLIIAMDALVEGIARPKFFRLTDGHLEVGWRFGKDGTVIAWLECPLDVGAPYTEITVNGHIVGHRVHFADSDINRAVRSAIRKGRKLARTQQDLPEEKPLGLGGAFPPEEIDTTLYRIVPFKMPAEETDEERERNRAEAQRFDPEEWRGTPLDPYHLDYQGSKEGEV